MEWGVRGEKGGGFPEREYQEKEKGLSLSNKRNRRSGRGGRTMVHGMPWVKKVGIPGKRTQC